MIFRVGSRFRRRICVAVLHGRVQSVTWAAVLFTLAFDSSVIKGRGILSVVLDLFIRVTRRASGLQVKSAMTGGSSLQS